ncbi:hypothetical protein ACQ4PT_041706 [Festuca glaucescens]
MATSSKAPFLIRFGGKRLRKFVDNELSVAKRDVITTSYFADLARISRFHVPEELLEWVVMNIDPKLREYHHKVSKPIVFTRDMMTKVFNVPTGERPVERLKNTEHTELRNMYHDGEMAPIAYLEKLLHDCVDDDVVMIKRSFALLAFAIVLFSGTNNMVPLDYMGSLLDMDRVHEYAWDEAILAYCMDQVAEFQEKRRLHKEFMKQNPTERLKQFSIGSCLPALVIVYIDHLDFPIEQVHGHVFDYSLPRALHVCNTDFELAMAIDRNKKTLELSVFGKWPVPTEFNALYEKHKTMFKREVNDALSSFGLVVQSIQCNQMALLLKNVSDAARNDSIQEGTNESNGINFDVPNLDPEAVFRASVSMGSVGSSPDAAVIIEEASVGIGGGFGVVIVIPPCFKIGGFFTSYQNWQASLRPHGDLDNEVMALYIEYFNLSHKTSRKCKKYAFPYLMSDLLSVNPARFVPSLNCLREFNRACDDFKAHKSDLDYIPIFRKIVAATLFNKPMNEIDTAVAIAEQAP